MWGFVQCSDALSTSLSNASGISLKQTHTHLVSSVMARRRSTYIDILCWCSFMYMSARTHTHTHARNYMAIHLHNRATTSLSLWHIITYIHMRGCWFAIYYYTNEAREEREREKKKTLMLCCIQNKSSAVLAFISVWHVFISILTLSPHCVRQLQVSHTHRFDTMWERAVCCWLILFLACCFQFEFSTAFKLMINSS